MNKLNYFLNINLFYKILQWVTSCLYNWYKSTNCLSWMLQYIIYFQASERKVALLCSLCVIVTHVGKLLTSDLQVWTRFSQLVFFSLCRIVYSHRWLKVLFLMFKFYKKSIFKWNRVEYTFERSILSVVAIFFCICLEAESPITLSFGLLLNVAPWKYIIGERINSRIN